MKVLVRAFSMIVKTDGVRWSPLEVGSLEERMMWQSSSSDPCTRLVLFR